MASEDEENDAVESEAVEEAEAADAPAPREETPEAPSSESRRKIREQMQAEIEAYLRSGGRIEKLEPSVTTQTTGPTAGVNDLSQ
jgi:hypothetical protein